MKYMIKLQKNYKISCREGKYRNKKLFQFLIRTASEMNEPF